jgi:hypothetical protein
MYKQIERNWNMNRRIIEGDAKMLQHLMGDNCEWSAEMLMETSGLDEREFHAAIGWLAKMERVNFIERCGKTYLSTNVNVYIG